MAFRIKLPKNEERPVDHTPRIFLLFGRTMEGKTYMANEFPNPLNLSTDTNAEKQGYAYIDIKPVRITEKMTKQKGGQFHGMTDKIGKIGIPTHDILTASLNALSLENQKQDEPFETLIIDVVDDLAQLTEEYTLDYVNEMTGRDEQYLGDFEHGVAWGRFNNFFLTLVTKIHGFEDIKYIVWISRSNNTGTERNPEWSPALRNSLLNKINGEGDFMIECSKIGKNYTRKVKKKRNQIDADKVKDVRIRKILDTVDGAYRDLTTEEKRKANLAKRSGTKPVSKPRRKVKPK